MDKSEEIKNLQESNDIMLSFSCGKDSIISFFVLKEQGFNVIPFFYYLCPDLSFQNEAIDYYSNLFKTQIQVYPSHAFLNLLTDGGFQPPGEFVRIYEKHPEYRKTVFRRETIEDYVRVKNQLSTKIFTAVGITKFDSMVRRMAIEKHGVINYNKKKYYPISEWTKKMIWDYLRDNKIKISKEYKAWGQSLDGLNVRWLEELKQHFPSDYEKIKFWFPLIDVELLRKKSLAAKNLLLLNRHKKEFADIEFI